MVDRSRRFSSEEVAGIVRDALEHARTEENRALSYEDLEDVARECGVDPETLARTLEQREQQVHKDEIRRRWRFRALARLALPLFFCGFFVFLNLRSGGFPWALFPIAFWLVPVAYRCKRLAFPSDEALTRAVDSPEEEREREREFEREMRMLFEMRPRGGRRCGRGGAEAR